MKNLFLAVLLLFSTAMCRAQSPAIQAYIDAHKEIAIQEMLRTGVPASIKLAQGIIETQAGQSPLVLRSNNHFGIKCKNDWTGDKTYHDDDARGECFRVYGTAAESFRDHSDFLKTRAHYAFLFKLDPTDYEGWAKGLKRAGYATNPRYPEMLIKTIVENNLQQYTLIALNMHNQKQKEVFAINTPPATEQAVPGKAQSLADEVVSAKAGNASVSTPQVTVTVASTTIEEPVAVTTVKPNYPQGVFFINNVQVVYAQAGTSLLALATKHNIAYNKLLEFNEMEEMEILDQDQLLFLQKKAKKGAKDYCIIAPNETLREVSQREGIRMESLLLYNKLQKGDMPAAGQKLYLRSPAVAAPKLASSGATASS